jgi:hypothetical protein
VDVVLYRGLLSRGSNEEDSGAPGHLLFNLLVPWLQSVFQYCGLLQQWYCCHQPTGTNSNQFSALWRLQTVVVCVCPLRPMLLDCGLVFGSKKCCITRKSAAKRLFEVAILIAVLLREFVGCHDFLVHPVGCPPMTGFRSVLHF